MTDNLVILDFTENSNANVARSTTNEIENCVSGVNNVLIDTTDNLQVLNDTNCIISLSTKSAKSESDRGSIEEDLDEEEHSRSPFIPEVNFGGISTSTLDSIERESQPLLGREHHEITYNQFPGKRILLKPTSSFIFLIANSSGS